MKTIIAATLPSMPAGELIGAGTSFFCYKINKCLAAYRR